MISDDSHKKVFIDEALEMGLQLVLGDRLSFRSSQSSSFLKVLQEGTESGHLSGMASSVMWPTARVWQGSGRRQMLDGEDGVRRGKPS